MYNSEKSAREVRKIRANDSNSQAGLREEPTIPGHPPADPHRTQYLAAAFAVTALGALARFLFIGRYEIWLDEAYCFMVARQPLSAIPEALAYDNGPPLYYFLLHFWMRIFGESSEALRSLSALFSTASVAVLALWNTPWLSRPARLYAALILAITPLGIYYAHEARMYSPVLFFVLVSIVFLEKALRLNRARDWTLYGLFTALALYTSYIAIFTAPLGYVVIALMCRRAPASSEAGRRLKRLVIAHVLAALAFAPWLPVMRGQPSGQAIQWIRPMWEQAAKPVLPIKSLSVMTTGGAWYPTVLRHLAHGPGRAEALRGALERGVLSGAGVHVLSVIPPALPLALSIALTALMWYYTLGRGGVFAYRGLLLAWLALALLAPFTLSFLRPMYLVGRYEITALPAFAIISGIGLSRMNRPLGAAATALAVGLFLYTWGLMQSFPVTGRQGEKAAAVARLAGENDVVLCMAFEYAPVYYHAGVRRDDIRFITFPREMRLHPAWLDYGKWFEPDLVWERPTVALAVEARETVAQALNAAGTDGDLILVRPLFAGPSGPPAWAGALNAAFVDAFVSPLEEGRVRIDAEASQPEHGVIVTRVRH